MGFQGKSYLNDTKTEQDQTNRTDKAEDEIGQVVDNGKRDRPAAKAVVDIAKIASA